ncbi:hypothetical protein NQZ68_008322 [Dissostichus eleginoides]|nr:hypothetical protein NQZ68_008322 [Dissostichus eleginoides]
MFAVRIVTADFYLASPIKDLDVCYSEFRESVVKKVPVVRIFGATPAAVGFLLCTPSSRGCFVFAPLLHHGMWPRKALLSWLDPSLYLPHVALRDR